MLFKDKKKFLYQTHYIVILLSFLFIYINDSRVNSMDRIKEKDLQIILVSTHQRKDEIQFEYSVNNLGTRDIWICVNMNRNQHPNYKSLYDTINQKLQIRIENYRVPSGVLIEDPIYARFIKLLVGQKKNFTLKIKLPIQSFDPLDGAGSEHYKLANLREICLSIAYYDLDLEKLKNDCCIQEDKLTMLVNCFWAENNLEKFIYLQVFQNRDNDY